MLGLSILSVTTRRLERLRAESAQKHGANAAQPSGIKEGVFWISLDVQNMDRLPFEQDAPVRRASFRLDGNVPDVIHEFVGETIGFCTIENPAELPGNGAFVGVAKAGRRLDQGLQYRLQVESRAADDLEHIGRCRLLLQRLPQLLQQPIVFDRYDGLLG